MHRYYGLTLQLALSLPIQLPSIGVCYDNGKILSHSMILHKQVKTPTNTHTHTKTQGTIMMLEKTSVVAVNRSIGEAIYMLSTAPTGLRLPQFGSNFWLVNS